MIIEKLMKYGLIGQRKKTDEKVCPTISTSPESGQSSSEVSQAAGQVEHPSGICRMSKLWWIRICSIPQEMKGIHTRQRGFCKSYDFEFEHCCVLDLKQ